MKADIRYLSTTLIRGYPECPARVVTQHAKRQDEGDSDEGSDPTRFGSVVHDACEKYHRAHMRGKELPDPLELFDETWREHKCSDFEYYQLGRDNIEDFLDRTLHDRKGDTVAVEFAFVMDLNTLEIYPITEDDPKDQWVDQILGKDHVPFVSKIDRIDKISDGVYEVYDYKTNVTPFTRDEVDNSIQLRLYDVAVRSLYEDAEKVRCVFDMLRFGRQPAIYDDTDREEAVSFAINIWHQIQKTDEPEERINPYCKWCHRRSECDEYKKVLESDVPEVITIDSPESADEFGEIWDQITEFKDKRKILKKRQKELEASVKAEIEKNTHGSPLPIEIDGEEKEIYFRPNRRYEYPIEDVYVTLEAHNALTALKSIASVSNTSLRRFLKMNPQLKDSIEPLKMTKHYKPSLRSRLRSEDEDE